MKFKNITNILKNSGKKKIAKIPKIYIWKNYFSEKTYFKQSKLYKAK